MDEDNSIRTEKKRDFEYITNDIIYLLRIEQDDKSHYIYKHIERLFNLHSSGDDKDKKLCPMCNGKIKLCEYSKHISMCYKFCKEGSILKLPEPGSTMKFKKFKNKLERPFIVYADTECTLEKVYGDKNKMHKHVVSSCCYYFVCSYDSSKIKMWYSTHPDCIEQW